VGDDAGAAYATALEAARAVMANLDEVNRHRAGEGKPEIRCGIGLHVGDVQYGNIGARDRLDFKVIGRAVNEASRVESLCRVLERRLLATAPFAGHLGNADLISLGFHVLRGVREPQEIFGLGEPG